MKRYKTSEICKILGKSKTVIYTAIRAAGFKMGKNKHGVPTYKLTAAQVEIIRTIEIPESIRQEQRKYKTEIMLKNRYRRRDMPVRYPTCRYYHECLTSAAIENGKLDCSDCNRFKTNELWAKI